MFKRNVEGPPQIIGTLAQCDGLERDRPVLLCGDLVLVDAQGVDPGPGFVRQADRRGVGRQAGIGVWVREEAVAAVADHPQVALAVDAYLAWGRLQTEPTVLLAGYAPEQGESNVEVYGFVDGAPVKIQETVLPPRGEDRFVGALHSLIDDLRQSLDGDEWRVVISEPLVAVPGIEHIGDEPLSRVRYRRLRQARGGMEDWARRFGLPLGVLAAGGMAYVAAISVGYWRFDAAIQDFQGRRGAQTQTLTVSLERLEAMRGYLSSSETANARVATLRPVIEAVARVDGVVVRSVALVTDPSTDLETPPLELVFTVPRKGESGMAQGEALRRELVLAGWDLWIEQHRDITVPVRGRETPYRVFVVKGQPA